MPGILGISNETGKPRILYSMSDRGEVTVREAENINAYLAAARDVIVAKAPRPLGEQSEMDYGNKPTDGGSLILSSSEYLETAKEIPGAFNVLRRFIGSSDGIDGSLRYCLWIDDDQLRSLAAIERIRSRLDSVRTFRSQSTKKATVAAARSPHRFQEVRQIGNEVSVVVPRHSSESRKYLPFVLAQKGAIVADSAFAFYNVPWWNIAVFGSRLHLVWVAAVCGKIKTDYRYSNTLGWNTFPVPSLTDQNKADLTHCAEDILLAREAHFPATIADLYDPDAMPANLREAHERNDDTLERIYIGRRFKNDTERLEKLFELYTQMTAREAQANPKGAKKVAKRKT